MADLFFYGSLLDKEIFEGISGLSLDDVKTTTAKRLGFKCTGMLNWSYPMIVEDTAAELQGTVFHDIAEPALSRIKFYEGDEYHLVEVDLMTDQGPTKAYVFEGSQTETSDGKPWSYKDWQINEKPKTLEIIKLMMPKFGNLSYEEFNRQWDDLEETL